jgi:tetratricopeptide (TPR) repeat protein
MSLWRKWKRKWKSPSKLRKKSLLKSTRLTLTGPFRFLYKAVVSTAKGIGKWWKSRQWRRLLWGLPALLTGGTAAVFAAYITSTTQYDIALKYKAAGEAAMRSEDWDKASLCLERCVTLGVHDQESLFSLARAAEKRGDESQKFAVLSRLAPDDTPVYAPAHFWKATQLLSSGAAISQETASKAEKQLRFVLQLEPENPDAHSILGDLYFQAGIWRSAIEHLQQSRNTGFKYRLLLAKAHGALGKLEPARSYAENVLTDTRKILDQDPGNMEIRLQMGEAALLLEEYEEAVRILQEGLSLQDSPAYRQALALVLIHWADSLLEKSDQNAIAAFQLLAVAVEQNPNEFTLFDRILSLLRQQNDTSIQAEAFLKRNIVDGKAVGLSHLILGTHLLEQQEPDQAGLHLEQAFQVLPNAAIVANNLAWCLVKGETKDPERALVLIDQVIARDPDFAEYYDTRGHILLELKRWKEAAAALEKALSGIPPNSATHLGLSDAYRNLGMTEISDEHRRRAEQLAKSEDAAKN